MGLDFLLAEHMAEAAAEQTDSLVAPTLPHGYGVSSADFPGAVTLRAETLIALVEDTLRSLMRHGVTPMSRSWDTAASPRRRWPSISTRSGST
jgi:creatinine amidohydrolase